MSNDGFQVNLDDLRAAATGVRNAVSALGDAGGAVGLLTEIQSCAEEIGHPALTAALHEFGEYFDGPSGFIPKLTQDGHSAADALDQAARVYAQTDKDAAGGMARIVGDLADDLGITDILSAVGLTGGGQG